MTRNRNTPEERYAVSCRRRTDYRFKRAIVLLQILLIFWMFDGVSNGQTTQNRFQVVTPHELADVYQRELADARAWTSGHYPGKNLLRHLERTGLVRIDYGRPVFYQSVNANAAAITRTVSLYPGNSLGVALTGAGMTVGIWDAGHILSSHSEYAGRVSFGDKAANNEHATHVAGTLGASGIVPEARGMAYEALIVSYDWQSDGAEMLAAGENGLFVSNHSYGPSAGWSYGDFEGEGDGWYWMGNDRISPSEDYTFGFYDREAERWDRIVYQSQTYLPVISAGNDRTDTGPSRGAYRRYDPATGGFRDATVESEPVPADGGSDGYDTIAGAALAKNVLAVGSVDDVGIKGDIGISAFSSYGPADDGRIKPDIVANGDRLFSSSMEDPSGYATYSGTSMSSPNTAGSLLLLQQLNLDLTGEPLRSATLRALVCHTATDLGPPGPDYASGWGLLNAEAAAERILQREGNPFAIVEDLLDPTEPISMSLEKISEGPVRVTLAWNDQPAEAPAEATLDNPAAVLVDDLDMRLIHRFTGDVFEPYVRDPVNPKSAAVRGDNAVDPIEQIFLPSAPIGAYVLEISADASTSEIPFGLIADGITDRERLVTVGGFQAIVRPSEVLISWQAISQSKDGWFLLDRAHSARDMRDVAPSFVRIDSIYATHPISGNGLFEVADRGALPGHLTYRLSFRQGDLDPTVEAETTLELPLGESDINASVSDGRIAIRAPVRDLRHATTFTVDRSALSYDATGQVVLSPPQTIDGIRYSEATGLVTLEWTDQPPAGRYRYEIRGTYLDNFSEVLATLDVQIDAPQSFDIRSAYPNPFTDRVTLDVDLPESTDVLIRVFDTTGRIVHRKTSSEPAGRRIFRLDLGDLPAGMYFVFLDACDNTTNRAITHMK